ncbi:MAG: flagellum-specific ATP synthase FliI, partial [Burkholderiales bacterium]
MQSYLRDCRLRIASAPEFAVSGTLTRAAGLVMEAVGLKLAVGSTCILAPAGSTEVEAEVVGFSGDRLFLMPSSDAWGMTPGTRVTPQDMPYLPPRLGAREIPRRRAADRGKHVPVGPELLGRVLDGAGRPLDRLGPSEAGHLQALYGRPANPLERAPVDTVLDVGVRTINALLTVGRGQRMGLFAGSGVGKSVLLGMMARYTSAEVIVVGLIGERGREVKEFIEQILGAQGLARAVVIATPADTSPLMRLQGAAYATAVAEFFRDQGRHVLLLMDSL